MQQQHWGSRELWDDIRQAQKESDQSNRNSKFKAVQLGKVGRVKDYQMAVLEEWPKGGQLCQRIAAFSSKVSELGDRAWEDKEVEASLVKEGDQLMAEATGALLTTTRLAPPSPRHQAVSCLGLPRGLGGLGA